MKILLGPDSSFDTDVFTHLSNLNVERFTPFLKMVCTVILCNGILQYSVHIRPFIRLASFY